MKTTRTAVLLGCVLAAGGAGAYQNPGVLGDIRDIADDLEKGKDVKKKVAALKAKEPDVYEVMQAFRARAKGGIGYGPKGIGIEAKIAELARRALTKDALAKEGAELARMLHLNRAMARIVHEYAPAKPRPGKANAAQWKGFAADQDKAANGMLDAIRKGDPALLKKKSLDLSKACNDCHR
ncbi:MAG: hypothetical protein K2W96_08600 [Gemmataceae bacterium]|nr:hypothetical protein [Gemmataceae bacterium]